MKDSMRQEDKPPIVALACAICGEKVEPNQEHVCKKGDQDEKAT